MSSGTSGSRPTEDDVETPASLRENGLKYGLGLIALPTMARRGASDKRIATMFDPDMQPDPEPCPYCGAMLPVSAYRDDIGEFVMWSPFPDPCANESCREKAAEADRAMRAEWEAEEQARRDREFAEAVRLNLRASGLGRKYRDLTFDDYRMRSPKLAKARQMVQRYNDQFTDMERDGMGLYIAGDVGTGKTHLAAALVNALIRRGIDRVLFVTAYDLLGNLKAAFGRTSGRDPAQVLTAYKEARLLVIDDFGKARPTEWALEMLMEIIDSRDTEGRPTVYTSNFVPSGIESALARDGEADRAAAITSRIDGNTLYVPLVGTDYRKERAMHLLRGDTA